MNATVVIHEGPYDAPGKFEEINKELNNAISEKMYSGEPGPLAHDIPAGRYATKN